jgi:hypothetical protein
MERRRRLGDLLARPAGELLTNGLDHLPLPRHHLQGLGGGLAELGEPAAAARAGRRAGDHDTLARQMCWKGRAHRLFAGEGTHRRAVGRRRFVFGCARRHFLELQFQLVEQLAAALRGLAVLLAPELGDQQLVVGDQRFGAGGASLGLLPCLAFGGQCRGQRLDRCRCRHEPDCRTPASCCRARRPG